MFIIETDRLSRRYKEQVAVESLDLRVARDTIFGLIGSNGAGKTTTTRILTTLLPPSSGTARVNGFDIVTQAHQVRESIGYVPQEAQADEALTGREHLLLQGRLSRMDRSILPKRVEEMLELVGLAEHADNRALHYSGGMRKLLDIACGLLSKPKVVFLDEPTSGVDVTRRSDLLEHIRGLPAQGTTVFLTSHFLPEVERLADRVALLDRGTLIAEGTPAALKVGIGSSIVDVELGEVEEPRTQQAILALRRLPGVIRIVASGATLKIFAGRSEILTDVKQQLDELTLPLASLRVGQPTLDDVFFFHVGREVK